MTIADISDISLSFKRDSDVLPVLESLSFSVKARQVVCVMGPSGCGKSSLLRCVAGLLQPKMGRVTVAGRNPEDALQSRAIGFMFQEPTLISWRTVYQNVALAYEMGTSPLLSASQIKSEVFRLLEVTGLESFHDFLPLHLSGGMKQRVALARALVGRPRLLLFDEPFGSLDVVTRARLAADVSSIIYETESAAILVTHSVEEAVLLGTDVIVLSARPATITGRIAVEDDKPRYKQFGKSEKYAQYCIKVRNLLTGAL